MLGEVDPRSEDETIPVPGSNKASKLKSLRLQARRASRQEELQDQGEMARSSSISDSKLLTLTTTLV